MKLFPKAKGVSLDWYKKQIVADLTLTKSTKIVSMGSCFATHIKQHLVKRGYNYLQYEHDKNPWIDIFAGDQHRHKSYYASCAWERVYGPLNALQIIEDALGVAVFPRRLYEYEGRVHDLLRTRVVYPNKASAETDLEDHQRCVKDAIYDADVFILTLGLVESWFFNGFCIGGSPAQNKIKGPFKFKVQDAIDIIFALGRICTVLTEHVPNIKILFTVSPVHLRATFREDMDVVSASCFSKSLLRACVDKVVRTYSNVYYFPSYEIVTILLPMMGIQAYGQDHHVNETAINKVMDIFTERYCNGESD